MSSLEVKPLKEYFVKIPYGSDLLATLKETTSKLNIRTGAFNVIGALQRAVLHYYLQDKKFFHENRFDEPLEIVSGMGNIARKGNETIVHCHLVLANKEGHCFGGHLAEGSKVFAGELYLRSFEPELRRKYDEVTGLNLFDIQQ